MCLPYGHTFPRSFAYSHRLCHIIKFLTLPKTITTYIPHSSIFPFHSWQPTPNYIEQSPFMCMSKIGEGFIYLICSPLHIYKLTILPGHKRRIQFPYLDVLDFGNLQGTWRGICGMGLCSIGTDIDFVTLMKRKPCERGKTLYVPFRSLICGGYWFYEIDIPHMWRISRASSEIEFNNIVLVLCVYVWWHDWNPLKKLLLECKRCVDEWEKMYEDFRFVWMRLNTKCRNVDISLYCIAWKHFQNISSVFNSI